MASSRDHYVGRLMRPKGRAEPVYVVTGTSYDVAAREDYLRLRRIRPLPPAASEPRSVSGLEECSLPDIGLPRDGLAELVARTSSEVLGTWTAFDSRTEFKEYQFRPLIKFQRSPSRRLLIADEVGLGKTIEAAYIIVEELAAGNAKRVLVLCPAGLRLKWQDELWRRFGLYFEVTNGRGLKGLLSSKAGFMAIASYDLRWEGEGQGSPNHAPSIDLLVIDEVHNLIGRGGETLRRTLTFSLSRASKSVVALSATPIHLGIDDLRRVLEVTTGGGIDKGSFDHQAGQARAINRMIARLVSEAPFSMSEVMDIESLFGGRHGEETATLLRQLKDGRAGAKARARLALELGLMNPFDILMTRTRKKDVGESRDRLVKNLSIRLDKEIHVRQTLDGSLEVSEQSLYEDVDRLLRESFGHVHRLQLSSCLPAMVQLLRDGMKGFDVWQKGDDVESELSVADRGDQEDFRRVEGSLSTEVKAQCQELVDSFGLLRVDSKLDRLRSVLEVLKEPHADGRPRKAIIFTQWRHTWAYLARRLGRLEGVRTFALSGEDDPRKVTETLQEFQGWEGPALLVSTDFLSEGLDLQSADMVVNYDFPFNPQRVEQRIGRVDRVGQASHEIRVFNLVVEGSQDQQILGVLRNRLDAFMEAIGDAPSILKSSERHTTSAEAQSIRGKRAMAASELEETEPFVGVEDLLDEQTKRLRRAKTGDLGRLSWLTFTRMLTVLTGGRARMAEETPESLLVGPLADDDIMTIKDAAGLSWGDRIESDLRSHRDGRQMLRIAKTAGSEGLFLPPFHPLVRLAGCVTLNSLPGQGPTGSPLTMSSDELPEELVAIFRYRYDGWRHTETSLAYWGVTDGRPERLTGERLLSLVEALESVAKLKTVDQSKGLPQPLQDRIRLDFDKWCEERHSNQGEDPKGDDGIGDRTLECIAIIYRNALESSVL